MYQITVSEEIKNACPIFKGAAVCRSYQYSLLRRALGRDQYFYPGTDFHYPAGGHQTATRHCSYPRSLKRCGKKTCRYRPSAEALRRRLMRGIALYQIDTLVDLINLVSLRTGYSIGGFDADKIQGTDLKLGVGRLKNHSKVSTGCAEHRRGLPVYRDAVGGIGTPTSDNERTKMDLGHQHILPSSMVTADRKVCGKLLR